MKQSRALSRSQYSNNWQQTSLVQRDQFRLNKDEKLAISKGSSLRTTSGISNIYGYIYADSFQKNESFIRNSFTRTIFCK